MQQESGDDAETAMFDAEDEVLAPDEVAEFKQAALAQEEKDDIAGLLEKIRRLPPDTKAERLRGELENLRADGYSQTMVFTQYTDTMDFLRDELAAKTSLHVMCFSGRLQPILARMSGVITGQVLGTRSRDPEARAALAGALEQQAEQAKREGFDLDAMLDGDLQEPPRPMLTLQDLDMVLQRADSLPPALVVKKLQNGEYAYQAAGMANPVRITTRPDYFDEHSDSLELWSPGSPFFPTPEVEAIQQELAGISISTLLKPQDTSGTSP
jgi:hypothetical protein